MHKYNHNYVSDMEMSLECKVNLYSNINKTQPYKLLRDSKSLTRNNTY